MIVMQYKFKLPSDYNMDIIDKRIEENGAKLNGFPGLFFKAYLTSNVNDEFSKENSYAPLYVWDNTDAMNSFLQTAGFKKLTEDFGWPKINTWVTLKKTSIDELIESDWLSIEKTNIPEYSDLSGIVTDCHLCAWDINKWEILKINFQKSPLASKNNYRIKYIAK